MGLRTGLASESSLELGRFLRAHRERRQPADVGLKVRGRRRTPGLRREEVAALSGVSQAWYTWLEQGRAVPSKSVLTAVCDTLGLEPASVRHVMKLAGWHEPPDAAPAVDDRMKRLAQAAVNSWESNPALFVDWRFDVVAWNAAYQAVWCNPGLIPEVRRNLMWMVFGVPTIRTRLREWDRLARSVLAQFRAQTAGRMQDPRTTEIYRCLHFDFPSHSNWWHCRSVGDLTSQRITVNRPGSEPMCFTLSAFRPVDVVESMVIVTQPADEHSRCLLRDCLELEALGSASPFDRQLTAGVQAR